MTKDEALRLALDALTDFDYDKRIKAIEIIKEALKQEQDKPVALQYPQKDIDWQREQQIKAQGSTTPQRKPLTREDIDKLHEEDCFSGNIYEITAEIEAAHGIKE